MHKPPSHENIHTICDLADMGFMKVSGKDAKKFLQGQLTCHMDEVTSSQSRMGAHCNPQGRVISLFYIFFFHDSYYLFMTHDMVSLTMSSLKKFAIFYQAELSDASDDLIAMGQAGIDWESTKEEDHVIIPISRHTQRHVIVGEMGMKHKWEHLVQHSQIITPKQWKQLDLLDGIPTLHPKTSTKFLPHEINLDKLNALHFNKGCYTGQEIIARMHYRGKLKNHLYQTTIASQSPPEPGTDIYFRDGQEIRANGMIVDICHDEYNRYYALIISDESNAKNNHLFLEKNENDYFMFP